MITVPTSMPTINTDAGKTAEVGSASRLFLPSVDGANHMLGYVQDGLIHFAQWPAGAEGTGRVYTRRHANCDYVMVWAQLSAPTGNPSTFTVTAGTGVAQTRSITLGETGALIAAPWAAADAGWSRIEYVATGCDLLAISIWGLVRTEMDPATDMAAQRNDPSHVLAGLDGGTYLIHSSHEYNVDGLAQSVREAWTYNLRQAVTWCAVEGSLSVAPGAGVPANPFGFNFRHRARFLKAADTYRHYLVRARTWQVGAGTYTWTVTATNAVTTAALAGIAGAEDEATLTTLHIDCTADDDITFELTPSAAQTLHITDLSIVEYLA